MIKKKELKLINKFFLHLKSTLGWLHSGVNPSGLSLAEFDYLLSHLESVFKTRGLKFGIAYVKAIRTNVMNYLSGNPERVRIVKLAAGGIPMCLGPLRKVVIEQNPIKLRFVLTILFSTRALKLKSEPDIDAIIAPSKRGTSYRGISMFVVDFWKHLGYRHTGLIPRALKFKRFHLTTKSPVSSLKGVNALACWAHDLFILPQSLIAAIKVIGGETLANFIDLALRYKWLLRTLFKIVDEPTPFRRLAHFADKEGKTRVIALGDYFSQTALKRLHSYLFRLLKKIPQDMTFNQGAFLEQVRSWDSDIYYSVDLSSATDRFPISVIELVLRGHLPQDYVTAWKDIMVGYPFDYKTPTGELNSLTYSVGNPMGFYSSWASFAVAHHYIFYYIARILNLDYSKLKYCVLGDDVLIGDRRVGDMYLDIVKSLGVDVSMAKTHISSTTLEFAKRWIHKGKEISPFPVSALRNSGKRYYLLTNLLLSARDKGWDFDVPKMVGSYFGRFRNMPSRFRKSMITKSTIICNLLEVIQGTRPASHLSVVYRQLGLTEAIASNASVSLMLSETIKDLFIKSDPTMSQNGETLGLYAEKILIVLTGRMNRDPEVWGLLENPILHVQGSIEQSYLDSLNLMKIVDSEGKMWPLLIKNMAIPLSDKIFIDRNEGSMILGSSKVANLLRNRFKDLPPYEAPIFRLAAPS
nr:MAG: putative RNA dependent RNA polymerase [Guangdong mito-like virus 4]